jgi:hypothetical protein
MKATCRPSHLTAIQRWAEAKRCAFAIHVYLIPTTDLRHSTFQVHQVDLQANCQVRLDHTFRPPIQHTRVLIVRHRTCKTLRETLAMDKLSAFAILLATAVESVITVAQPLESAGCRHCLPDMLNQALTDHLKLIHPPRATPLQTTARSHSTLALALSLLSICFHVLPSQQCHRLLSRTNNPHVLDDRSQKRTNARFVVTSCRGKVPKAMKQTERNILKNASPSTPPRRLQYHLPNKHRPVFPPSALAA